MAEETKKMKSDFLWAVAQMKEGKKVRRKYWALGAYMCSITDIDDLRVYSNTGDRSNLNIKDIEATDWEVVEEKKKEPPIDIPTITEKASERKYCPHCDTGVLHRHVVLVDKGFVNYLLSLGKFKDENTLSDKIKPGADGCCESHCVVEDVKSTLEEFMDWLMKYLEECFEVGKGQHVVDKETIKRKAKELLGGRLIK